MTIDPVQSRERLGAELMRLRPELMTYLTRMVVRASVAEELVQTVAVRALEAIDRAPVRDEELRPWMFRIATNLAIDERRRHGRWRESLMVEAREACSGDESRLSWMRQHAGTPETANVAREHLVACFSCTTGQLPSEHAAALLLKEVYGFTTDEVAAMLEARFAQVKNWLQTARAHMEAHYAETCALIRKDGVCHQCVQLDGFFRADRGDPLAGTDRSLKVRLKILQDLRETPPGPWTHVLTELLDEI